MTRNLASLFILAVMTVTFGCASTAIDGKRQCVGKFRFVEVSGTHWKDVSRFMVIGPQKKAGGVELNFVIPRGQDTLANTYSTTGASLREGTVSVVYPLKTRVKGDKHPDELDHTMTVTVHYDEDLCPFFVRFDDEPHNERVVVDDVDHGGHAGAGRY
ncbi:MAG: hypothetical protein O7G86_14545 [Gammaproteobacteria bacterium]|nr:hypothetical protein [Gammaproteobacteria bacterium]MCZ6855125.1 hypothetical protein [Gammaproteobacteria bacterium]